ncbi:MAG: YceI family protein [Opitutae bacterium]|nr:YceI family protein [Opitutae bacterium]
MNPRLLLSLAALALVAAPLAAADRALKFDRDQSTIEVAVKATVDSFVGALKNYALTGTVDDAGHITGAELAFRFRDVATGKPKRDAAMHEWQHTDDFPDAKFTLVTLNAAAGATEARGRFTFHGVTRELRFPVTISQHGPTYAIDGDAAIDTRDYGLPVIRLMLALKVDPLVHVRFHFQAKAA